MTTSGKLLAVAATGIILALGIRVGVADSQTVPSCKHFIQITPDGDFTAQMAGFNIAWGINLFPKSEEPGRWVVDIRINNKRVDRKNGYYPYAPHGSLPGIMLKSQGIFSIILINHVSPTKTVYTGLANCRLPKRT